MDEQAEKKDCEGYIYCLYNPIFTHYGENVYKLGKTSNLEKRIHLFTTPYIEKSRYIITSIKLIDKNIAEQILFTELKDYRIQNNREFFNCDLELIKNTFEKIETIFRDNDTQEKLLVYLNTNSAKINKKDIYIYNIMNSEDLNDDEFNILHNKKSKICQEEKYKIIKYIFKKIFNIQIDNYETYVIYQKKLCEIKNMSQIIYFKDKIIDKKDFNIKNVYDILQIYGLTIDDLINDNNNFMTQTEFIKNIDLIKNIITNNKSQFRVNKTNEITNSRELVNALKTALNIYNIDIIMRQKRVMINKKRIGENTYKLALIDKNKYNFDEKIMDVFMNKKYNFLFNCV